MKDEPLKECPQCHTLNVQQVYHAPMILSSTPQTIGGLADRNSAKMGRYEKQEKEQLRKENAKKAAKEALAQRGMESARLNSPAKRPWWRPQKDKPDLKLAKYATNEWKKHVPGKTP